MIEIFVPEEQEGTQATVRNWLKSVGDRVRADEPLVELETDKVTQEVPAPADGVLAEICLAKGDVAAPGALLARLREEGTPEQPPEPARPAVQAAAVRAEIAEESDHETRLSPSARRALQETGVDLAKIVGTGHRGRVTRADIERAAAAGKPKPAAALPAGALRSHRIPHDSMRLRIAEHMSQSLSSAPHVTAVFEADFSAIIAHRQAKKQDFAKDGVNLTFTAYFIAACVEAMKVAPTINSRWHDDALEVFDDINIGVGTALGDKGLIVPVVPRAQELSLKGIAGRLQDLTERARTNKLVPADVKGGTFSISNHGVSGSLVASPIIINQPQTAILGIGKLEKRVVVRTIGGQDTIQIRPMAYVSLTIDHRASDGHQTNGWLTRFVETLENWPDE